jgi:hypothetical protein
MPRPAPTPPNPYRELSLHRLTEAIVPRYFALRGQAKVSRLDIANLLGAALERLTPLNRLMTSPYHRATEGASVSSCYFEEYLVEAKSLRYLILEHAADAIGMDYDQRKLYTNDVWRQASALAQRDDAGLLEGLRMLDDVRVKKNSREPRATRRIGFRSDRPPS